MRKKDHQTREQTLMTVSKIANTLPRKDPRKTGSKSIFMLHVDVVVKCPGNKAQTMIYSDYSISELKRGVARIVCLNERGGRRYQ